MSVEEGIAFALEHPFDSLPRSTREDGAREPTNEPSSPNAV
jgi:hypothetical protein